MRRRSQLRLDSLQDSGSIFGARHVIRKREDPDVLLGDCQRHLARVMLGKYPRAEVLQIVRVACGSGTIYALEKGGAAFAWGGGSHGELGIGSVCHSVGTPSRMLMTGEIEYMSGSAGGRFGAAVDSHGRLFTFGNGELLF